MTATEGTFKARQNDIIKSQESEGKGREVSYLEKKPLSSVTISQAFIRFLLLATHHFPSVLICLLLSTSHISQCDSSTQK